MKASYSEQLRDPRWQRKRLEVLQRDGFMCQLCQDTETELQVHHRYYTKKLKPWEYDDDSLVTLCKGCHQVVTDLKLRVGKMLSFGPYLETIQQLLDLLQSPYLLEISRIVGKLHREYERNAH